MSILDAPHFDRLNLNSVKVKKEISIFELPLVVPHFQEHLHNVC